MGSISRLKASSRLIQKFKPSVPDKLKGGKLEKLGNYFYNIFDDYRIVFREILQDIKTFPLKATVYGSLLGTGLVMLKTNPSAQSFHAEIVDNSNMLSSIGEPIRNPVSDSHVTKLSVAMKDGTLKVRNFKFFTLVFLNEFPAHSGLFEANCSQVKPHWTEWYKPVIEVGVFGKWIYLTKAMKDYDINPDEWLPNGQPKHKYHILPPDE